MLASIDILAALELVAFLYFMRHIKLRVRRVRYLLTIHTVPAEAREPGAEHIDAVRRRVRYLLQ